MHFDETYLIAPDGLSFLFIILCITDVKFLQLLKTFLKRYENHHILGKIPNNNLALSTFLFPIPTDSLFTKYLRQVAQSSASIWVVVQSSASVWVVTQSSASVCTPEQTGITLRMPHASDLHSRQ